MSAPFLIGDHRATILEIVEVGRRGRTVALSRKRAVIRRIQQSRQRIARALERGEIIYAVNTGVGTNAVFLLR